MFAGLVGNAAAFGPCAPHVCLGWCCPTSVCASEAGCEGWDASVWLFSSQWPSAGRPCVVACASFGSHKGWQPSEAAVGAARLRSVAVWLRLAVVSCGGLLLAGRQHLRSSAAGRQPVLVGLARETQLCRVEAFCWL